MASPSAPSQKSRLVSANRPYVALVHTVRPYVVVFGVLWECLRNGYHRFFGLSSFPISWRNEVMLV